MKVILTLLVFVAAVYFTNTVFAQQKSEPVVSIQWNNTNYLFYNTPDIKKLDFTVTGISEEMKESWIETAKKSSVLSKIEFSNTVKNSSTGIFIFSGNIDEKKVQQIFEELGIHVFYVNDKKIITETLITIKEAQEKAMSFVIQGSPAQPGYNDSNRIEYYNFQMYYFESKLQYMWANNYVHDLYEGYVAKMTEQLNLMTLKRDNFLKRNNHN
jgi:hypothetical protein